MSKLLTLGILQQVQNGQGGLPAGVLYDGEMTVGDVTDGDTKRAGYWWVGVEEQVGSINPTLPLWNYCAAFEEEDRMGNITYGFSSNYPDIGSVLAHYEFGGTVYTSRQSLYDFLDGEVGNTISLKVYEDAQ